MLKNYFKIAWRNMMKNKTFSFINIMGLTIGLTSFLLIALYVFDELTFDRFHKKADSIYRIVNEKTTIDGKVTKIAGAGYQLTEKSGTDFPEVKKVVRLVTLSRTNVSSIENTNVFYENFSLASPGFLTAFDFKLIQGDRFTALSAPHSVIVTEESARKMFGTTSVLDKII